MWREPQLWPPPSDLPSCITLTESQRELLLNGISHEIAAIRIPKTVKHIILPFLYSSFEFDKSRKSAPTDDADSGSSKTGLELRIIVNKVYNCPRPMGGSILSFRKDMGIWYSLRQTESPSVATTDGGGGDEKREIADQVVIGTYGNAADYSMRVDPREYCHVEFRVVIPSCYNEDGQHLSMDQHQIETISRRRKVLRLGDIPVEKEGGIRCCTCSDDDSKIFALPETARRENVSWGPSQLSYQRVPFVNARSLHALFPEIENAGVETGGGGALAYLFIFLEMEEIVDSILRVSKTFAKAGLFSLYFHKQFSAAEYCRMYDLSKGGIGESLLLRIAKWNQNFDFDYVVEMREDPHPVRSEEDYRPWWEHSGQWSWEEERQYNVLWYCAYQKFTNAELREVLLENANSSALESRHLCEYFRTAHKQKIVSETARRMLTCPGVDLTDQGRLRSLLYCASCQCPENTAALKIFMQSPKVQEALQLAKVDKFVRSLALFDNIDGVRLLVEATGTKAAEAISQDLLSGLLRAPQILKYCIDKFGICPTPGFLQGALKMVYQAGELTEKLRAVVQICLDDALRENSHIVPSDHLPIVMAIDNSDLVALFRAHPRVLPRHFKLVQVKEDDVDLAKRVLGISEDDGEFFIDAPLDVGFADELLEDICLKGFAQVGSMLLKVTDSKGSLNRVFVPTEDSLMKAIDPGVGPHTQFTRNNPLIVVLVKEGRLSLRVEHFDALVRLYNLDFLEELYPDGGFEDLSDDQFMRIVGEVADKAYETGFVQKLLETRGLAVLPKMSSEIRNGLLLKVCKTMSELLPLILKSENFFVGLEVEPAVLKNLVSNSHDCDLIEFFLSATKMSAAQVTASEAIPEASGDYQFGDKKVKLLLEFHPDVDPSHPNNEALQQALWRQNYPTVDRLLQDPRVQEMLEAQMCIDSLMLSPHSDEKWVEVTEALLSIERFDPSSNGFAALISSLQLDLNGMDFACRCCFLTLFRHSKVQTALDASILPYLLQTTAAVPSGKFDLFFEVLSCFEDARFSVVEQVDEAEITYESIGAGVLRNLVDKASVHEIQRVMSSDFVRLNIWKVSEDHVLGAKTRDRTELVEILLREIRTGED